MADTELLPCPFCGAIAKTGRETLDERFGYANKVTVFCTKCSTSKSALGDTSKPGYADNSTVEARAVEQWNRRAPLASRPAEVDDMMPVTEPVAWRHTLDEGSYFANGRNYQLLDDWDAAFADWMLHGGVLQSLYSGPDTHELTKEADDERAD